MQQISLILARVRPEMAPVDGFGANGNSALEIALISRALTRRTQTSGSDARDSVTS